MLQRLVAGQCVPIAYLDSDLLLWDISPIELILQVINAVLQFVVLNAFFIGTVHCTHA